MVSTSIDVEKQEVSARVAAAARIGMAFMVPTSNKEKYPKYVVSWQYHQPRPPYLLSDPRYAVDVDALFESFASPIVRALKKFLYQRWEENWEYSFSSNNSSYAGYKKATPSSINEGMAHEFVRKPIQNFHVVW